MSQDLEQNQMDQFVRLVELSFLREKRKQMKQRLQREENSVQRLIHDKSEQKIRYQRKMQLIDHDKLKFREASQILEEQRKEKLHKNRKIAIYITLIIFTLATFWYFYSK